MDELTKAAKDRLEYLVRLNQNGALRSRELLDEYIALKSALKYKKADTQASSSKKRE